MMFYYSKYETPLGPMTMESDGEKLTGLYFDENADCSSDQGAHVKARGDRYSSKDIFAQTGKWLDAYFSGENPGKRPPLKISGTPFGKTVLEIVNDIPYGDVMTYGEIADIIAKERGIERMSAQAVGAAVSKNPIAIIVPCHRVIGANGKLVGYAAGLHRKEYLLKLENIL